MNKRGLALQQVVTAILALAVAAFVFFILGLGTANAPTAVIQSEMQKTSMKCGFVTSVNDADGDGIPDECDLCVDVAKDSPLEEVGTKLRVFGTDYIVDGGDSTVGNVNNDNDLVQDVCERTARMDWILAHPIRTKIFGDSAITEGAESMRDPRDTSDKFICRFWYSSTQCCSRYEENSMVKAYKKGDSAGHPSGERVKCFKKRPS